MSKINTIINEQYQGDIQAFLQDVKALEAGLKTTTRKKPAAVASTPVIIELRHVERTYKMGRKTTVKAVQGIDLQIHEGEIVALTGPSGSGKSTLMHLIGGLDQPTSGEVLVDGQSLGKLRDSKLSRYRNRTIGFVFQFFYLQPFLQVKRNVEVPLMFAKTKRNTRAESVQKVIDDVGLTDRATYLPKELSGGQMQRVAIARALANRPKILLADEPTGNLDSKNGEHIMELLKKVRDTYGTTMIVVTHDPRVASWADREIRLEDGMVLDETN